MRLRLHPVGSYGDVCGKPGYEASYILKCQKLK